MEKIDGTAGWQAAAHEPSWRFVTRIWMVAAGCGAFVAIAGTLYWQREERRYLACVPETMACLRWWPLIVLVGGLVAVAIVALVLRFAGGRRVVSISLLGILLLYPAVFAYEAIIAGTHPPPVWGTAGLGAVAYLASAVVIGPRAHWTIRVLVVLMVAMVWHWAATHS